MSHLSISASFEYLCYGSTTVVTNNFTLTVRESDVYRRQTLTYKDGPRAERVSTDNFT